MSQLQAAQLPQPKESPSAEEMQELMEVIQAQNEIRETQESSALTVISVLLAMAAICAWFAAGRLLKLWSGYRKVLITSAFVPFVLCLIFVVGLALVADRSVTALVVSPAGALNYRALGSFAAILVMGLIFSSLRVALFKRNAALAVKRNAKQFE